MTPAQSDFRFTCGDCRWIVFDAVGTLIHPKPSVAEAYHRIAAKYGSRMTTVEIGNRFRAAFRESEITDFGDGPARRSSTRSSDAIEIARWRWIVKQVVPDVSDRECCFQELWDHFADPASWACFKEVGSCLRLLRESGYRLAIASNFDSRLHGVCDAHAPLKPIERRFVSSETGFRKPAAEFYAAVASQLNCRPDQIFMVGDDPEHDVAGPRAAGMQAVHLDRKSRSSNSISSLEQLLVDHQASDGINRGGTLNQALQ